jgi:hypothetical protein
MGRDFDVLGMGNGSAKIEESASLPPLARS